MTRRSMGGVALAVLVVFLLGVAVATAQAGQATLIVVNYVGGDMIFTLDGTTYTVSGTGTVPEGEQLRLALDVGQHEFSAHIPGGPGSNGMVELAPAETYVLGARLEESPAVLSPDGIVLEKPKDQLVLFEARLTPAAPETPARRLPLLAIPAGQGALVLDNYIGEALLVNIGDALYTVPVNGRTQVDLPPGQVGYSASAGTSSMNAAIQIVTGEYTGLGFSRELPTAPDYTLGKLEPTPVPLKITVIPVPLGDEPVADATFEPIPEATDARPTAGDTTRPADGLPSLTVINYAGQPLTFTINDVEYRVAEGDGEVTIVLTPGEYAYTAATPGAAANGKLVLAAGAWLRLSVSTSLQGDWIYTYFE